VREGWRKCGGADTGRKKRTMAGMIETRGARTRKRRERALPRVPVAKHTRILWETLWRGVKTRDFEQINHTAPHVYAVTVYITLPIAVSLSL